MRPRQKRAIALLREVIATGSAKSMCQILLDAGYAETSVRQYTKVMSGIRPHVQDTIDWMEEHRVRIQLEMDRKIEFADYAELSRSLNILTHNLQLLQGRPTANIAIAAEVRLRIDSLLET